jgi:sec-independent protein translocase protein TatA
MVTLAFGFGSLSGWDLFIILGIGLLIFGGRLPQVGKNLGKGIVEFKKGLKSVQDDIDDAGDDDRPAKRRDSLPEGDRAYRAPDRDPASDADRRVSRQDVGSARPADEAH